MKFLQSTDAGISGLSYLLAILTGVLMALSFPKPEFSLLAWGCFVPLLWAIKEATPGQAFRLGFTSAITAYSGILYWLTIVMNSYGNLPMPVSIALMLCMAAANSVYIAAVFGLFRSIDKAGVSSLLTFPVIWVGVEYLRSFALTGFPWASLGYSQYRTLPLIQIADIAGIYLVSFLIAVVNISLFRFAVAIARGESIFGLIRSLCLALILIIASAGYGFYRLNTPETGETLKIALIQGNIAQDVKWDPAYQEQTIRIYERLTRSVAATSPELTVWPESATPFFFQSDFDYAERVKGLAKELKSPLLFGSPAYEKENGKVSYLNSAFLISPAGEIIGRGDKIHLVPFGEYVPLQKLLPFVSKLVAGIGDFSPGKSAKPLDIGKTKIGTLICYEGIFPEISREYVNAGARLLVNISNDAWYKRSSAPYQHLSMTVFRAVENRVPLVRATNTGVTAIIDSRGHFQGLTYIFKEATLTGEVRLGTGGTIYNRYGDLFAAICLAFTGLCLIRVIFQYFKKRRR